MGEQHHEMDMNQAGWGHHKGKNQNRSETHCGKPSVGRWYEMMMTMMLSFNDCLKEQFFCWQQAHFVNLHHKKNTTTRSDLQCQSHSLLPFVSLLSCFGIECVGCTPVLFDHDERKCPLSKYQKEKCLLLLALSLNSFMQRSASCDLQATSL